MNIFDNNQQFVYTSLLLFFIYYGNIIYIKNSVRINREAFKFGTYLYKMVLYKKLIDDKDEPKMIMSEQTDENIVLGPKYEDKYLSEIRKLNKEFIFSEEEEYLENDKMTEFLNKLKKESDTDKDICIIMTKAKEQAKQFVIEKRLEKLKDCFVMEKTPLGNVLMTYNVSRNSFQFYSDNVIPYRYLEPVGRKFVKFFDCRPIYYDMEEELKNCEIKLEREEREKEEELKKEKEKGESDKTQKKNVFAKFKSYNKESGTGHVNTGVPPKNSIHGKQATQRNLNAKILLKENANRYTYEGKLSNFNILKKVDKKLVDKKLALSFADFKKQQLELKNEYVFLQK
jgi:hypothetical protein